MAGGYRGQADPYASNSPYNAQIFLIRQVLAKCNHITLVKIVSCTNSGELSPVGFVDIQPLVNMIDGDDKAREHGTVYGCLYFRLQGGSDAIIIDPKVGDIGLCCFADRDISSVKINKRSSNPGSGRTFDFADGIYLGGVLNGTPNQYVRFSDDGIEINSPSLVNLVAPDVQINCSSLEINATISTLITSPSFNIVGNVGVTGTLTNNTVDIGSNHQHSGVETGTGITGTPI